MRLIRKLAYDDRNIYFAFRATYPHSEKVPGEGCLAEAREASVSANKMWARRRP